MFLIRCTRTCCLCIEPVSLPSLHSPHSLKNCVPPPHFQTTPSVSRRSNVAELFCSRWSAASHLCCLCDAVICLQAGFVGLPVWGQAWGALMMEIAHFAAASVSYRSNVCTPVNPKETPWEDWLLNVCVVGHYVLSSVHHYMLIV